MSQSNPTAANFPFLSRLLDFKGRISAAQYWGSIFTGLAFVFAALFFGAMAMDPRGGNSIVLLGIPLFGMFIWIVAAAMAQRFRDAGYSPWHAIVVLAVLLVWIYGTLEMNAWLVMLAGIFAIFAAVGHIDGFRSKHMDAA